MKHQLRILARISWLGVFALACDRDEPTGFNPPSVNTDIAKQAVNLPVLAARQISAAVAGRDERGEEEEMLKIEAQLPGFGGTFVAGGEVVAYIKQGSGRSALDVRNALVLAYASRKPRADIDFVRSRLAQAKVEIGAYSLSELIAMQALIVNNTTQLPGWTAVGAHIPINRVKVFFKDSASLLEGLPLVERLGVPRSAIEGHVLKPAVETGVGFFSQVNRPSYGGVVLVVGPEYLVPPDTVTVYVTTASHGFNVVDLGGCPPFQPCQGVPLFFTAAHAPNNRYQTNGHVGAPVFQNYPGNPYGTITNNPPYQTQGCPAPYTLCNNADVALGTYNAGITYVRRVGLSKYGGINGNWGTDEVGGRYAIEGVISPNYVDTTGNGYIHKSGFVTGTTTGNRIGAACTDVGSNSGITTPPTPILRQCTTLVGHAGWGLGDSGGAVFGQMAPGGPYYALGIFWGGSGNTYQSGPNKGRCSAGVGCTVLIHQWSNINARFQTVLEPKTILP